MKKKIQIFFWMVPTICIITLWTISTTNWNFRTFRQHRIKEQSLAVNSYFGFFWQYFYLIKQNCQIKTALSSDMSFSKQIFVYHLDRYSWISSLSITEFKCQVYWVCSESLVYISSWEARALCHNIGKCFNLVLL